MCSRGRRSLPKLRARIGPSPSTCRRFRTATSIELRAGIRGASESSTDCSSAFRRSGIEEFLWRCARGSTFTAAQAWERCGSAELAAFGMVGVGTIFEDYARTAIEDDDEVVRVHGGAAKNYEPTSEAMVNIRRTLAKAVEERIICKATAERLAQIGKGFFYRHRQYEKIVDEAVRQGLNAAEVRAFPGMDSGGASRSTETRRHCDADADAGGFSAHPQRKRVNFSLEYTKYWDRVERRSRSRRVETPKAMRRTTSKSN